ncbi:hypothetical protein FACS189461_1110 [Spirochaetia bacterium]|nr:hypothetical protein FACS189461_1110 [Spirochaetia bacterium]
MKQNKMGPAAAVLAAVLAFGLVLAGCASIVDATVSSAPAKTVYGQGQELDVAGMVVTTTDSKGKTKEERITAATRVTGFDSHRAGKQTLSIAMGFTGKVKATFEVNVMPLESITVSTPPAKVMYKVGEEFDASGLSIRGTWAEIGDGDIPASGYTLSGYDKTKSGDQSVTITAEGVTTDLSVSVVALASITIAAQPTKIKYNQGEDFDTAGLRVRGNWPGIGESDIPASNYEVLGYDKTRFGSQAVTISSEGKSASINVQVLQLVALAVTAQPAKTKYSTGEALDLTGLVVNGTFMDGRNPVQSPVNAANTTVSGFDSAFVGPQRVTLTIGSISTSFTVTVEQGPSPLEGKWENKWEMGGPELTFSGNTFSLQVANVVTRYSGTFVFDEARKTLTLTITQYSGFNEAKGANDFNVPVTGAVVTCTATLNADKTELVFSNKQAGAGAGARFANDLIVDLGTKLGK